MALNQLNWTGVKMPLPVALGLLAMLEVYATSKIKPSHTTKFLERAAEIFEHVDGLEMSSIAAAMRLMDEQAPHSKFDPHYSQWVTVLARVTNYQAIQEMAECLQALCDLLLGINSAISRSFSFERINPGFGIAEVGKISSLAKTVGAFPESNVNMSAIIVELGRLSRAPRTVIFPELDSTEFEFGKQADPTDEIPLEDILNITGSGLDEPAHDMQRPWQLSQEYVTAMHENDLSRGVSIVQTTHDRRPAVGSHSALFKIACSLSPASDPSAAIAAAVTAISLATRAGNIHEATRITFWLYTVAMDMFMVKVPDEVGGIRGLWEYLLEHRNETELHSVLSPTTMAQLELYASIYHGDSVERIVEQYQECNVTFLDTFGGDRSCKYAFHQLSYDVWSTLGQGDLLRIHLELMERTSFPTELDPSMRTVMLITYCLRSGFDMDCTRAALRLIRAELDVNSSNWLKLDQLRFWRCIRHILEAHLAVKCGKLTLAEQYLASALGPGSPNDRHLTISARLVYLNWLLASHRYSQVCEQARAYCAQVADTGFSEINQCSAYNLRALEAEIYMADSAAEQLTKALATAETLARTTEQNGQIGSMHRARYFKCVLLGRLGRIDDAIAATVALVKVLGIRALPISVCSTNLLLATLLTAKAVHNETIDTRTLAAYTRITELLSNVYHLCDFDGMREQLDRLGRILDYMTSSIESCSEIDSYRSARAMDSDTMSDMTDDSPSNDDYQDLDVYLKPMAEHIKK